MKLQQIKRRLAFAISLSFGILFIAITLFYTLVIKYLSNNITIGCILAVSVMLLLWYYNKIKKEVIGRD